MSSANDRQVGGAHYQDETGVCPACGQPVQHWDLFAKMPYLVGQVCKYVLRFRGKNGKQDLEKARHFLDKLVEVYYPEPKVLCEDRRPDGPDNRCTPQLGHTTLHTDGLVVWNEAVAMDHITRSDAADARARADVYANQKPNQDVPPGWVLEEAAALGTWHYRPGSGGALWSPVFNDRTTALEDLKRKVASTTPSRA